ncbi:Dyp-type peroxidase [Roseateles violae]|uniref:Dyp-type peroxidase n=1 Tax=Roseateles violae TaxID=3058042 RepID=A0ABT8DLC3_9BURK|nr:Dyp-type peroxidase [Pelomonas sp. PFR6]MDN3918907.1 Dyp-type peroxidase [Pelomonas sp. PFR6]
MSANRFDTQLQGITDLTLITPIRNGFVTAPDTISHVGRLRAVLKTLNGLRLGAREASNPRGPYTDVVSRFRIVHSFRWVIIEPKPGSAEQHKLLLNVCFDGGWEPYMRVIWDQLGSMLDLILCHCEDYPLACQTSFERYCEWVRANEIPGDFLFIESGRTVSDAEYLALLEQQQRDRPGFGQLDAARVHAPLSGESEPPVPAPASPKAKALLGLPALAALYRLERYFYKDAPDGDCLLRAARDILAELLELKTEQLFPAEDPIRQTYHRMLGWFEQPPRQYPVTPRALSYSDADIQGGMLAPYAGVAGGAMVLLRIVNRAQAVAWLSRWQVSLASDPAPIAGFYRNVALSLAGLRALGVPASRLERFPQAFYEGMEARAGLLGDLRYNHPQHWKLPERNWPRPSGRTVDLGAVHLLIQLRHGEELGAEAVDAAIAALEQEGSGLQVLSVQRMRRTAQLKPEQGEEAHEGFGFVDGLSQPAIGAGGSGDAYSDEVPRGELLLGYPTSRDRHAVPELADALLDRGTFLVVRKLRQYVDRFNKVLAREADRVSVSPAELKAKLMGRTLDGDPLARPGSVNDFDYRDDMQGSRCPFHAHVRRSNPRIDARTPRLLRRGMPYGEPYWPRSPDESDRGLIFLAYNAHISEQFETIQRWIAGGNSSGGYSAQTDPIVGLAEKGRPRHYRFETTRDGKPYTVNIDLGDEPFVELQWGGYFFVPSVAALRQLPALVELPLPAPIAPPARVPALDDAAGWQQWLEDSGRRDAAWAWVRSQPGGVVRSAYGVLVGEAARVMEVFRDRGQRYSVAGYGERMEKSVGRGFLGMDEDGGHREQAPGVNAALEAIGEPEAFDAAYRIAKALLTALTQGALAQRPATLQQETPIDLELLSEQVLARLCTTWFGLPDGRAMWGPEFHPAGEPPAGRCPRDFFAVSRYVFGPHPSPLVEQGGMLKGQALLHSVRQWLASGAARPPLTQAIVKALQPLADSSQDADLIARTLTGVMLGFPPTTHGNLLSCLGAWVLSRKLWDLQQDWLPEAPDRYAQAAAVLRPSMVGTLVKMPTPAMVWRRARVAHRLAQVDLEVGDTLIVGIASATQQNPGEHYAMFGGDRRDAIQPAPLHACPGYAMAMGVMQGVAAALLEAGTLRPGGAPTVLMLQLPPA